MRMKTWPEGTTVAEALAEEREKRHATYQLMADEMDTNTARVNDWMTGAVPTGRHVDAMAKWLGTNLRGIGGLMAGTMRLRTKPQRDARAR